jgi:phosphoglycolate phosphatase-like HAD superfamily hydrolase
MTRALAIDLDGALGDTRPLWNEFLAHAARRFGSIAALDPASLPSDRGAAAEELDAWAAGGVGDWRAALERFAEDRVPVFLRPDGEASAALRSLASGGIRRIALAHLGAERRVNVLEAGAGAQERLIERLGPGTTLVSSREDLVRISRSAGPPAPR